jgi:ABC-2 type transport system permease protein
MKAFPVLWKRELDAYFLSPVAYVTLCFFLLLMGLGFWSLALMMSRGAASVTLMKVLFVDNPLFWVAMLVTPPLITMRLFAEEKRSGSIETLMTAPVTDAEVVLAKYAGALTFFILMWLPTAAYVFILHEFTPRTPIDTGPLLASYGGALLAGAFFLSVGVLASALAGNQATAAIACFCCLCLFMVAGVVPQFAGPGPLRELGAFLSPLEHMLDLSRGAVDSRPVVLYLTLTVLMLFAAVKAVEARRWR